jgi:hypothetical protein
MKTESFLISSNMTHQGYPLSIKRNDFRKKRLLVTAGHLQLACKNVRQRIIICKYSGFRAYERTGLSTIKGPQCPWISNPSKSFPKLKHSASS